MVETSILLGLSSPAKAIRLRSLETLSKLPAVHSELIETLVEVENVPSTIADYRQRESLLERFLRIFRTEELAQNEENQLVSLRYLLGSLYVNFQKFWGPTVRVIADFIGESKLQQLLVDTVSNHLKETNDLIYNGSSEKFPVEDRPDHVLHRNFLFQIQVKFATCIERDSKLFVEEFFRLAENELMVSPFIERSTREDLTTTKATDNEQREDLEVSESVDNDIEKTKQSKGARKTNKYCDPVKVQKQKSRETLITASKVVQSFKNPKLLHRSDELKQLFMDFLCCRDGSIQKVAFDCIVSYEDSYVTPYVDRITKVLNDKMVKTEMTFFSLDAEETDYIDPAHRPELMPILLRILFGKMVGKVGRKSAGKDKAEQRKMLIFRFIASCSLEEILSFLDLIFEPLDKIACVPFPDLENALSKTIDIHNYVPLNKLQAMINSVHAYMETIGHLRDDSLSYIFKIICIIVFYVITPLEDQHILHQLNKKSLNSLRALKRDCSSISTDFFKDFEYYDFTNNEINYVFKYLVWNSTSGFVDKNYALPTQLFKMIQVFASNRRYHPLLIKRNKQNHDEYLLHHVVQLYAFENKPTRSMLKMIATVLADIIDSDRHSPLDVDMDQEDSNNLRLIVTDDVVEPHLELDNYKEEQNLDSSVKILLAYIPKILDRLRKNCLELIEKKNSDFRIEDDELFLLSSLSRYLKDPQQSMLGASLLLSSLPYQRKNELILSTMKTIQVLISQVQEISDSKIVQLVANVIGYQRDPEQRREMCKIVKILGNINSNISPVAEIIELMNDTSDAMIDAPNLASWNEGFHRAFVYLENLDETSMNDVHIVKDAIILLVHQVGFIINSVDRYEFSVRENCNIFYEKLSGKIKLINESENEEFLDYLVGDIILDKYVKKGLRETNDLIKHTYLQILRPLAMECHSKHKVLKELNSLCHSSPDLDFWLNVKHIQLHNRSKALARLLAGEEIKLMSPKVLSSFIMPIASGFLFSKNYKSLASLTENSIKLMGIICNRLNWITYKSTLNYYLDMLTSANSTYQRTNIKLITEILKNFNFDLTACKEAMELEVENAKLEKRMKKRKGVGADNDHVVATDAPVGKRLNQSTAKMIYLTVTKQIIPRLCSCLNEMTRVEFEHDKNMSDWLPEKEEIKRIPIAYAIVQLLNLLPGRIILFRDHLPSLFLKLTSFLKSKNENIRKVARLTLVKIMTFIGPSYMPDFLRVMKQNLDKGFQIHVLNYTVHSVLEKMPLYYGCLDSCVEELIASSFQEIFGKIAEDKEIAKILAKTFEAKKTKSYDTLLIVSSHISATKLNYLMQAIKDHLKQSNEPKKVNKLTLCIQKVFTGLSKNDQFPLDKLLSFIQATIEESIPNLKVRQRVEQAKDVISHPIREDRFLIKKDFSRRRVDSKINERGNFHILVENSLRLLVLTLDKNKVIIKKKATLRESLDCFIKLLSTCLKSSSPRCVMRSLKCIHFIARSGASLTNSSSEYKKIVKRVFILLNLYNGVGMVQGDNFEMIAMCFKTLSLLLLKCPYIELEEAHIRALFTYIEQDIYDTSRQATAFETLRSLLLKKCNSPELEDIMVKIADLMLSADEARVRSLSIKNWQIYLLDYQHESTKLQSHLTHFMRQLEHETISGRKAAIKVLDIVVSKFPEALLREFYELMFHLLAQRLVNEESKEVRVPIGKLIGLLIQRLSNKQVYLLVTFVLPWANHSSEGIKLLGIKLLSIFIECCRSLFKSKERIKSCVSILADALEIPEVEKVKQESESAETSGDENSSSTTKEVSRFQKVTNRERLDYHSLRLFKRLLNYEVLTSPIEVKYIEFLRKIWHSIASKKLNHWHLPVVLASCELYSIFISKTDLLQSLNATNPSTDNYLDWNAKAIVRTLADKYLELLDRVSECPELLSHVTSSLIALGQLTARSQETLEFERKYLESFEGGNLIAHLLSLEELPDSGLITERLPYTMNECRKRSNLVWLAVKVVMQAKKEAALLRLKENTRRNFVLQWVAAVAQELGPHRIAPYLLLFMMTPIRELTDKGKASALANNAVNSTPQDTLLMCQDLLKFLKSLMPVDKFNQIYSKLQLHYTRKRVDRKKKLAILKIRDQARGVKRKLQHHKDNVVKKKKRTLVRKERMGQRKVKVV